MRVDLQIGLEKSPDEYLATMVAVFREVRRVLRPDGCCFVNLGDSYAGYHGNKNSEIPTSSTNGWTNGYNENQRASPIKKRDASGGMSPNQSRPPSRVLACDSGGTEPAGSSALGSVCPDLCGECRGSLLSHSVHRIDLLEAVLRRENADWHQPCDVPRVAPVSTTRRSSQQPQASNSVASSQGARCLLCDRSLTDDALASARMVECTPYSAENGSASRSQDTDASGLASDSYTTASHRYKPKDLLMMPARLALALQAPQHYGPIAKETDRAWMAAFMDGEGTISIARNIASKSRGGVDYCQPSYTPFVTAGNQDVELVEQLVQITGCGKVGLKDRPYIDARQIKSRRDYYGWRVDAKLATAIIRDIYPFLIAKRKQAILAYNLSLSNEQGRSLRGNGALPRSEQEKREHLKLLVNACNQRQPVDMPSWLIEPPSNFEQGWWLRSDIIWYKKNPMPESVTDRPTSAHEHVFLLTKSGRYYYDADAVREEAVKFGSPAHLQGGNGERAGTREGLRGTQWDQASGRNLRCCAACGAPWTRQTEKRDTGRVQKMADGWDTGPGSHGTIHRDGWEKGAAGVPVTAQVTVGWLPSCSCGAGVAPCAVLDPFGGAGTTGMVADRLGRDAILIELNESYVTMMRERITKDAGMFAEFAP